jgi:hypothetical protein
MIPVIVKIVQLITDTKHAIMYLIHVITIASSAMEVKDVTENVDLAGILSYLIIHPITISKGQQTITVDRMIYPA